MEKRKHLIDTNYLVRLATKDDYEKAAFVAEFLVNAKQSQEDVYVSLISIFELFWVLNKSYKWTEIEIINFLEKLYLSTAIILENSEVIIQALIETRNNNLGIEDNYNLVFAEINEIEFHSFDADAKKAFGK